MMAYKHVRMHSISLVIREIDSAANNHHTPVRIVTLKTILSVGKDVEEAEN